MIVNSSGQIAPKTVHDHGPCPICPNLRSGHNGISRVVMTSQGSGGPAVSQPASSRAAHPVPPCPPRTILTSNDPPENGKTDFLKFLVLRCSALGVTSRALAGRDAGVVATRAWSGAGGARLAVAGGTAGPGAPGEGPGNGRRPGRVPVSRDLTVKKPPHVAGVRLFSGEGLGNWY